MIIGVVSTYVKSIKGSFVCLPAQIRANASKMHSITLNELQFEEAHGKEVGQGYADEIQVLLKGNNGEEEKQTV